VISTERLKKALLSVITRNSILRTAYKFNTDTRCLEQEIKDPAYSVAKSHCQTESELIAIRKEELTGQFFHLSAGIVTRLHLVKKCLTKGDDDDFLVPNDTAFICIHYIAIDGSSGSQFLLELSTAYKKNSDDINVLERFRYIDFSIHERALINSTNNLQVTETRQFWSDLLLKYRFNSDIFSDVHVDQSKDDETSVWPLQYFTFEFPHNQTLDKRMLTFCSEYNFSLFQLGLTLYYVFLFKLTQYTDLCVLSLDANRYRPELQSMIGLFVNYVPYRLRLDPTQSFFSLLTEVRALTVQVMEHSYLPYQVIVQQHRDETQQQLQQFLTHLTFELLMSYETEMELDTAGIHLRYVTDSQPHFVKQTDRKRFYFTYTTESSSAGDFWQRTMSQRFTSFVNQLFDSDTSVRLLSQPVYELSLLLPEEARIRREMVVYGELPAETLFVERDHGRQSFYVLDDYLQETIVNQVGELYLGDMTQSATCEKKYKTNELVRYDKNGKITFVGMKADSRICFNDLRINTSKIERVVCESAADVIINCFVGKATGDDKEIEEEYLVAFVHVDANCDINRLEIQIGEHCERHLPVFMVPSYIVPVENQFPKDKMLLFEELSASRCKKISIKTCCIKPVALLERKVHDLWCQVLQLEDNISMSANFFAIGGNSLLLLKLWYLFQSEFDIDVGAIKTTSDFVRLYKQPTLREHVDLIEDIIDLKNCERKHCL
jgi:hypothetical protein